MRTSARAPIVDDGRDNQEIDEKAGRDANKDRRRSFRTTYALAEEMAPNLATLYWWQMQRTQSSALQLATSSALRRTPTPLRRNF